MPLCFDYFRKECEYAIFTRSQIKSKQKRRYTFRDFKVCLKSNLSSSSIS